MPVKDETSRVLPLAAAIFPHFAPIAMRLSNDRKSRILGGVGAQIVIASRNLEIYAYQQNETLHLQLEAVLVILSNLYPLARRVEQSDSRSNDHSSGFHGLLKLVECRGTDPWIREAVRARLAALDKDHTAARKKRLNSVVSQNALQRLFAALEAFNKPYRELEDGSKRRLPQVPNDYPASINEQIYKALKQHLECDRPQSCKCAGSPRLTRLCLRPRITLRGQDVLFDLVFSGGLLKTSEGFTHWQLVRFLLSSNKSRSKPKVSFIEHQPPLRPSNFPVADSSVNIYNFGSLIDRYYGPIWFCARLDQGKITRNADPDPGEDVEPTQTISLSTALSTYRLTGKMRLVLAYIIAHSIWRYYSSDFMESRWSTDSIHFLKERTLDKSGSRMYASNPCYAVPFPSSERPVLEYHEGVVAHRYPRVLALGNLLLDIGRRRPISSRPRFSRDEADQQINNDCAMYRTTIKDDDGWPYLGGLENSDVRTRYKDITSACFDRKSFLPQSSLTSREARVKDDKQAGLDQEADERRAILYERIVVPLEELLERLGWIGALDKLEPMEEQASDPVQPSMASTDQHKEVEGSGSSAAFLAISNSKLSSDWLLQIQNTYALILQRHRVQFSDKAYPRIKVAVLDTGYDPEAEFFMNRDRRARLYGWRDWVAQVGTPQDDDGHGSRVLSLLMKEAPFADVYVARMAKNSRGLEHSSQALAEAIIWATQECNVDVVSMSFGFTEEERVDGRYPLTSSILQATSNREGKILLFAPAGNEGANIQKVMFPARHDLVVPIYGTDARGAFLDYLNPRMKRDSPYINGTLAEGVPCSGRHSEEGEVYVTGTSFATAIAAGLAATLLEYVQLLQNMSQISNREEQWIARLSTKPGMLALFKNFAEQPWDGRCYLNPIHFFQQSEEAQLASIIKAVEHSR